MKTKLFLFMAFFALNRCGISPLTEEEAVPDFFNHPDATQVVDSQERFLRSGGNSIESARKHAEGILIESAKNAADSDTRGLFQTMATALGKATINTPPPGKDLKSCQQDSRVLAFVNLLQPGIINVCGRAASANESRLSQVLIHETAHVVGIHDECNATKVEVAVMRAANGRLPFRNGYMKKCGIK
jgi:hypothetical protein